MKKSIAIIFLFGLLFPFTLTAQETKPVYKLGGFIEFKSFFDDYRSQAGRNGLQYKYPLMPNFNSIGDDLNISNSLNFSTATSRLSFSVSGVKIKNAEISSYVEADFLGTGESYLGMLNLRHAYFNINWKNNSLLFGQTLHLTMVNEVSAGTISFAAGYPFNSLHRGMQIKYSNILSEGITLSAAADFYTNHNSTGPSNAQMLAVMPDIHVQLKFGDPDKLFGGVTFGYKMFKPRSKDATSRPISTTVGGFDINGFFKASIDGYSLKLWGIYGENLSMYNMLGGYGKVSYNGGSNILDFDYTNMRTLSAWGDFETPSFKNYKFGLFYGYQRNMGTKDPVDLDSASDLFFRDQKLEWFSRISPRVVYSLSKKLIFGLEYNFTFAQWAETIDQYLKPTGRFDINYNNRLEFMAKFVF